MRFVLAALVAAAALHAAPALAEAASDAQANASLAATAVALLAKIQAALEDQASPVASMGVDLWRWLVVLALTWGAAQTLLAGLPGQALIAQAIRVVVLAGFTWWLLPGGRPEPIIAFLSSTSGQAVSLLSRGAGLTGQLSQVTSALGKLSAAIATAAGRIFEQGGVVDAVKIAVTALPILLMLGLAEIGAFLASGLVLIAAAGGQILLAAAAVLAPLFIPWLMISYTSFLFWGWLLLTVVCIRAFLGICA